MSACLDSLYYQRVCADLSRKRRLVRLSHRHPGFDPGGMQIIDYLALGAAEREGDHCRPLAEHHLELGLPIVIGPSRFAGLGPNGGGLNPNAFAVRAQIDRFRRLFVRNEQVDAERSGE